VLSLVAIAGAFLIRAPEEGGPGHGEPDEVAADAGAAGVPATGGAAPVDAKAVVGARDGDAPES
jgi:hypothetical protein